MENQHSIQAVCEFECNYINAVGYLKYFQLSSYALRIEPLNGNNVEGPKCLHKFATIGGRYGLRVVDLRSGFYKVL